MTTSIQNFIDLLGQTKTVPSWWPNRATRRAIKQRRESRLSPVWRAVLAVNPSMRDAIRKMA